MESVEILKTKVDKITLNRLLKMVERFFDSDNQHYLVTANPEFIMMAQKDEEFRRILNRSDVSIPDGIGLLWAAKFLSLPSVGSKALRVFQALGQVIYSGASLVFYPRYCKNVFAERVSGADLIWPLAELCAKESKSIYFLGGRGRVGGKTAAILQGEYSRLEVVGTYEGVSGSEGDKESCARISEARPDVLLVAYGHPYQEKWIERNLAKLPSVKLAIGVGGTYDFVAGKIKRAPDSMRRLGLEWLWRLIKEPKRFSRIFTATGKFVWAVYIEKVRK